MNCLAPRGASGLKFFYPAELERPFLVWLREELVD